VRLNLTPSENEAVTYLEFDDNHLLSSLFGEKDQHLIRIEKELKVTVVARGNQVVVSGAPAGVAVAQTALKNLYQRLLKGLAVTNAEVDAAMRLAQAEDPKNSNPATKRKEGDELSIATRKRVVTPRSGGQKRYIDSLLKHDLVFGVGPAGTGKTYLAVAVGVSLLLQGKVDRIILSRPAVEAGEQLGFLPGDIREKVDPYLRPLYDALHDMMPGDQVEKRMDSGDIEVAPLAFMRGRTLAHSYVILDEAQNTTPMQMKMFLTRLGEGSYMVITGDLSQVDLKNGQKSGLAEALEILNNVDGISTIYLDEKDVVRHPLVTKIVVAYGKYDNKK
jgi:phosphate starvation-inducible protein PhoH and related proteins